MAIYSVAVETFHWFPQTSTCWCCLRNSQVIFNIWRFILWGPWISSMVDRNINCVTKNPHIWWCMYKWVMHNNCPIHSSQCSLISFEGLWMQRFIHISFADLLWVLNASSAHLQQTESLSSQSEPWATSSSENPIVRQEMNQSASCW